ncbi:MAG: reverse transcriptase/maturase family protein [Fusobacteriaceae bacterium]|jgi:retron-type reverse transcriptase|nr:reverse transcriptase/maturase family protein [Fusobacteriaceae bacterium]
MKTYEEMCKFENLYNAHRAARLGKRGKTEVIKFEMNIAWNIYTLQEQLINRTWKPLGYYHFYVHDPKTRSIFAPYYADRVVQHCLCDNILAPVLDKRLIFDNAACRIDKGTHFSLKRLTQFLADFYKKHGTKGYFLKIDIRKYFDNIDHAVLKEKLSKVFKEKDILDMLFLIIDSYEKEPDKGLPLGNQTSQWFALYYLDGLDRLIKEKFRIKYYTRYMDDFILLHGDKTYLLEILAQLRAFAAGELHIEFNEKTQIFPVLNGVKYLGFHIYLTETGKVIRKVTAQTKKRYKRLLKKMTKDYALGLIDLDFIQPRINSYTAHLKHGHTDRLRGKLARETSYVRGQKQN